MNHEFYLSDDYLCPSEKWRAVKGFEGYYEVSNLGRVRSLSRVVKIGNGERVVDGKIIKPSIKSSYMSVHLSSPESCKDLHIHRLVAIAFVVGTGQVVRHLDGNRFNCHAENLAWGTYKDNENDKLIHGRRPMGESHAIAKLTEADVKMIREMHKRSITQLEIAKYIGVGRGAVGCVIRGETWGHVK